MWKYELVQLCGSMDLCNCVEVWTCAIVWKYELVQLCGSVDLCNCVEVKTYCNCVEV